MYINLILMEKDFYTIRELAELLRISKVAVFKRVKRGSIKGQKMGRDFIIFKKDLNLEKLKSEIKH
jgi:excisionase family DNA binding protein